MRPLARTTVLWSLLAAGCGAPVELDSLEEANTLECPMQTVEGLDVYGGDGTIDWAKVKASGRQFAFIKATQGNYNKQTNFAANWSGARAAGVLRSPYHFFDGTIDGVTQAHWFLDEIAAAGGLQAGDLPPMLDLECPTSSVQANAQANCENSTDSGWAPTAVLSQRVFDFLDTLEQATGQKAFIYSYPSWFAGVGFTDVKLAGYPLFIATYGSCASVPAPWTSTVFWQYSATGAVPGVTKAADVDRFVGTIGDLTKLATGPVAQDAGADLAPSADLDQPLLDGAPDGGGATHGGCSCRFGGDGVPPAWALLPFALVLARRRKRT